MKLYLAGPMSGLDNFNFDEFHRQAAKLREKGFIIYNPAETFGGDQTLTKPEYMRIDVSVILTVDGIAVLSGWEFSEGAQFEVQLARQLGLPIFDAYTMEEISK